jgi:hypothetical protein
VGRWSKPPTGVPTGGATDGALFGNGELAVVFGGQPDGFSYNFGMNSFTRATAGGSSVMAAPGGVDVYARAFHNASYAAAQIVENGTVTSTFYQPGVGTLRSSAFVAPMRDGVSLMVAQLQYEAPEAAQAEEQIEPLEQSQQQQQRQQEPKALELGVAARAGPLGKADDFLIWGPCSIGSDGSSGGVLIANRSNGEDWQDIYATGRPPTEDSYGKGITRVAIAVSATLTPTGGASSSRSGGGVGGSQGDDDDDGFVTVSVPMAGMDRGRSANGTVHIPAGYTLTLLVAVVNNRDLPLHRTLHTQADAAAGNQRSGKAATAPGAARYGDPVAAAVQALSAAHKRGLATTVHEATAANRNAWQRYWEKSTISLPSSPLTERFWWSSLYLLRLAAGGSQPPGLYGPFITADECEWSGDEHLNYNYQVCEPHSASQLG